MALKNVGTNKWFIKVSVLDKTKGYPVGKQETFKGTRAEATIREAELLKKLKPANRGSQLKMFDKLKPGFNTFLRPAMKFFAKLGVHPNHITLLGVALFAGAGFLTALGLNYWLWAFALLVLGGFMDGIDGQLAREYGKKSVFGSILDSSCDRITEILFLAGLLVFYMQNFPELRMWGVYLCYATISGSVMVSYVKACCDGAGIKCTRGFMQRPERLFLFGTGLVFGPVAMLWILGIISVLAAVTAMERLIGASIQCKRNMEASCRKD